MDLRVFFVLLILALSSNTLSAQVPFYNELPQNSPGFKFQGKYYETNLRGFDQLMEQVDMPSSLKEELNRDLQRMKTRKIVGYSVIAASAIGAGAILIPALKDADENNSASDGTLIAGLGTLLGGSIIGVLIKKNDPYKFINKFNAGMKNTSKVDFTFNFYKSIGAGFVLTF